MGQGKDCGRLIKRNTAINSLQIISDQDEIEAKPIENVLDLLQCILSAVAFQGVEKGNFGTG